MNPSADAMSDEESRRLEKIARISRSQVAFERSLKELSMVCILTNATILHNSVDCREEFTSLPPVLRHDFLKRLEAWGVENSKLTEEKSERVFSLVRLLLNEFITEFNFVVYSLMFARDQETWRLLVERCPELTEVVDLRRATKPSPSVELDVVPDLLKFKNLAHIKLQRFVFTDRDVEQLVRSFPDLRSLEFSTKLKHIHFEFHLNLFRLQKLETFTLQLCRTRENKGVAKFLAKELLYECIRHLPALKSIDIYPKGLPGAYCLNPRFEVLERPLALTSLDIKKGFKGWTIDMLPNVTKLYLQGPLRDVNEFIGLKNLNSLELWEVDPADAEKFLRSCGRGLEDLELLTDSSSDELPEMDAYQIFSLCPKLKKLSWSGHVGLSRPDLFPVSASNFLNLTEAFLNFQSELFPSSLQLQIITAPRLEKLSIFNLNIELVHVQEITQKLLKKEILQNLRYFDFKYNGRSAVVNEALVHFLKLLPCYAPRLAKVSFDETEEWMEFPDFLNRVKKSYLLSH